MKNNKLLIFLFTFILINCKSLNNSEKNSLLLIEFFSDKSLKIRSKEIQNFKLKINNEQFSSIDDENLLYLIRQNLRKKIKFDFYINGNKIKIDYQYISKKTNSKYVYCKIYFDQNNVNLKQLIKKGNLTYIIGEDLNSNIFEFTAMPNIIVDGNLNTFDERFNSIINNHNKLD